MFEKTLSKVFGSRNDRLIKEMSRTVNTINGLEARMQAMNDEELAAQTPILRQKIADGASVEDVLPEAFAVVREVSNRVLNMRHFDVQLIGGYGCCIEAKSPRCARVKARHWLPRCRST